MAKRKDHIVPRGGEAFRHKYRGEEYVMKVVEIHGQVSYSVAGRIFNTPSAAAQSITGNAVNGWRFWGIDG
jgi:hypothetical protein